MQNQENQSQEQPVQKTSPLNNLTYEDIHDIVERLVSLKSNNYTFDHFTADDIGQEIRMICLRALKHFDMEKIEKEKWPNFFGRCVDNGLKNLKRDKYVRFTPSCTGDCNLLHGDEFLTSELDSVCKKWQKFKKNLKRKLSIKHPVNVDVAFSVMRTKGGEEDVENKEMLNRLMAKLDLKMQKKILAVFSGEKRALSEKDIKKINDTLGGVLEN